MSEHPNLARMRQSVEGFMARDFERATAVYAEDVVWRAGGRSAISGTYRGRTELARWFEMVTSRADDVTVEPEDILADDDHLVIFLRVRARRDGDRLDSLVANAFKVRDGEFTESWFLPDDQAAWDRFWG